MKGLVKCDRSTMDNMQPDRAGDWIFGNNNGSKQRINLRRPTV